MNLSRFPWRIAPPVALLTLGAWIAAAWLAAALYHGAMEDQLARHLQDHARLVAEQVAAGQAGGYPALQELCDRYALPDARLVIRDPSGLALAWAPRTPRPTATLPHNMPEVLHAVQGQSVRHVRPPAPGAARHLHVAAPVQTAAGLEAVIQVSASVQPLLDARQRLLTAALAGGGFVLLTAFAAGWLIARRLSRAARRIEAGAQALARGDLSVRVWAPGAGELDAVARNLNHMAAALSQRLQDAVQKRNELEAVLASMVEGVVAVDAQDRIILLNQAAARLFRTTTAKAQGKNLQEVARNPDLQRFMAQVQALHGAPPSGGGAPAEGEITVYDGKERRLQAHGTVLRNPRGQHIGTLVALNDVTRLRKLEDARREFVANVSHELRTPITSIKGYVETMLDHAPDDQPELRRFLGIVAKQSDRLIALVEDLLTLSRIEQGEERIPLERGRVWDVLDGAAQLCGHAAQEKNIAVTVDCPANLSVPMNKALLQQAAVNLLDNAIKYSPPETRVEMTGRQDNGGCVIEVRDQGPGIEPEHIPRLFERFFRADKARSRKQGGTGLGLAIVKHIVGIHHGWTTVDSAPGAGSAFVIHLPGGGNESRGAGNSTDSEAPAPPYSAT